MRGSAIFFPVESVYSYTFYRPQGLTCLDYQLIEYTASSVPQQVERSCI